MTHPHGNLDDVITVEQAAASRGCSAATIWRAIKRGDLHARRVLGRTVVDVDAVATLAIGRWSHHHTQAT